MKCPYYKKYTTKSGLRSHPCGKCYACRLNKVRDDVIRCKLEQESHSSSLFVTLTFNDENLPISGSIDKRDLQLFFKRLRKYGCKFRYYACGEYGEKSGRPHYHFIGFGLTKDDEVYIKKAWTYGHIYIGDVNDKTIAYVAGYVMKKYLSDDAIANYDLKFLQRPFTLRSRRPGLGLDAILNHSSQFRTNGFIRFKGHKVGLSRYILSKIFNEEELDIIRKDKADALCDKGYKDWLEHGFAVTSLKLASDDVSRRRLEYMKNKYVRSKNNEL